MNASLQRKITYVLLMAVLFTGLIGLGGVIERAADSHKLAQRHLGNVNPVSGTAQLVLAGFRGVAVTLLWQEANDLKKRERWFEIQPVLESITLLQPNFIHPWTFQAWNMAYNIAADWEAVPDKYYWIEQGVNFMKKANVANKDVPDMQWYQSWLYYNRFGSSDEKLFLREMFRNDKDDEFSLAASGKRDNFEKAYDYFVEANDTVIRKHLTPKQRGMSPFLMFPARSKSEYANFLAIDDPELDRLVEAADTTETGYSPVHLAYLEKTRNAWRKAYDEWIKFGSMGEPERNAFIVRLEFTPQELAQLTEEQRYWVNRYQDVVNYRYWKHRAKVEASDEMAKARLGFFLARKMVERGNKTRALAEYERAFPIWRKILEDPANEMLRTDTLFIEDSQKLEADYMRVARSWGKAPEHRPFEGLFGEEEFGPFGPVNKTTLPAPAATTRPTATGKPDEPGESSPGPTATGKP